MYFMNYLSFIIYTYIFLNLVSISRGGDGNAKKNDSVKCEKNTTICNIGWESLLSLYIDGDKKYLCSINNLTSAEKETFRSEKYINQNMGHMTATLQCDNFNKELEIIAYVSNAVFLNGETSIKNYKIEVLPFSNMGIPEIKSNKKTHFYLETFYTHESKGIAHLAWELNIKVL